jgi:hypothetical protein
MEQLDQYKKVWQEQEITEKRDSATLYKMMKKNSSSLVKWIFYVSLIEFGIILFLNLLIDTDWEEYKQLGLYNFIYGVNVFSYLILGLFIFLFYRNYKNISIIESTSALMQQIIKTRKTVKYYILINLVGVVLVMIYSFSVILKTAEYEPLVEQFGNTVLWIIVLSAILFVVGVLFLIYMLVYGYFMRKLSKNYKELIE